MKMPSEVLNAVSEAVAANMTDTAAATEQALNALRTLPNFNDLVPMLLQYATQQLVYDARDRCNVRIKSSGGQQRVRTGESAAIGRIYESVYNYCIGGTILGDVTGDMIPGLRTGELNKAAGHRANAMLLDWLERKGVTGDRKVRDVVNERTLKREFDRLMHAAAEPLATAEAGH